MLEHCRVLRIAGSIGDLSMTHDAPIPRDQVEDDGAIGEHRRRAD